MNDMELLEQAAKAVGYRISNRLTDGGLMVLIGKNGAPKKWNPLADDGDTFRIQTKMKFFVEYSDDGNEVRIDSHCGRHWTELCGDNPTAAARRAITTLTAEIGKGMK